MKIPKKELKERRISLEVLANREQLWCAKHEMIITKGRMYQRHCYMGRNGDTCKYLVDLR